MLRITDGRANPLMDRQVVGVVFFRMVAMVAVVTLLAVVAVVVVQCSGAVVAM